MMVSFVLSFFPRDVLDEILNLIESVSEGFPSYSCIKAHLLGFLLEVIKAQSVLNKYKKIYITNLSSFVRTCFK